MGAEHVQKKKLMPAGMTPENAKGLRICSLDGDADRLVYSYIGEDGTFEVLDGDKIMALLATFVLRLQAESGV